MSRYHYLFFYILLSSGIWAQNDSLKIANHEVQISEIKSSISYLNRNFSSQQQQFGILQSRLDELIERQGISIRTSDSTLMAFKAEMLSFQETQAQTERALNLALADFQKKFESQNTHAAEMQATLESKIGQELLIAAAIGLILILLFVGLNRYSFTKGKAQHQANWNEFQDYFLKNQS